MKNIADVVLKAEMLEERGEYRKAERMYKKALAMQEKSVGEDHPELADYLYNLGMIQCALDKNTEAEVVLNRLLTLLQDDTTERDYDAQEIVILIDSIRNGIEEEDIPALQAATA
ncbi:MAG: tetratricopeptide repeat protein [Candidatus Melainabacteria bacterium]|nr:tetratricopeptide repeat protein [Candidatus Melainabacteria bacterium]